MPRSQFLVVLGLVASIAYLAISMNSGFIPHDEGLLGQSAERVLAGETPHIDFDEPYTGGLSYLHAAAFRIFGARSSSLRVVLFLFSIAFVVAYFYAVSRIVTPLFAVLVVFAAVAWSLKNYFAGLPSWYNLFFATFGTLALMIDTTRRQRQQASVAPLFVAGLMGGASILFKITGVFFVLAGLLYVLYDAHVPVDGPASNRSPRGPRPWLADTCAWVAPPATVAALLWLLRHRLEPMYVLHFLLPGALVAMVPWLVMRRRSPASAALADGPFLRRAALFTSGVALPPLVFLALYTAHHGSPAAAALYRGVLVLPQLRFGFAATPLMSLVSLLVAAPVLVLFLPRVQAQLRGRLVIAALIFALALVLALSAVLPDLYLAVWSTLRPLAPVFVLLAAAHLVRRDQPCEQGRRLYLLAAVVAFTSLIQYPNAFAIYFFYAAPLILLLMVEFSSRYPAGRHIQLCFFGFFTLFAVLLLNGANVMRLGNLYEPSGAEALLAPERINLMVPEHMKRLYDTSTEIVRSHTTDSDDIWAGPDLPQFYFFTRKRNLTRSFFDFFDPDSEANLLRLTAEPSIRLVVINQQPVFSAPISKPSRAILAERFPNAVNIGPVQIRWRSAGRSPLSHD